jgi:hypothetical protein
MTVTGGTRRHFLGRVLALGGVAAAALFHVPASWCRELGAQLGRIKGRIVLRADLDYQQWWSSMSWYLFQPKRYPDLIVRAKSDQDIMAALAHARENKLKVTVRSGGHNPAKAVLREGGMLASCPSAAMSWVAGLAGICLSATLLAVPFWPPR